nr:(+)-neomenthol dehydrogenase-like [Ipomoea batatas]
MSSRNSRRCAVVSGANRGIGHEICRQLASEGVIVVATARDEKRGLEAVEKLKQSCGGDEDIIVFHQLDVADGVSVSRLVDFVTAKFGKLDILVNNAGIGGVTIEGDSSILKELIEGDFSRASSIKEVI